MMHFVLLLLLLSMLKCINARLKVIFVNLYFPDSAFAGHHFFGQNLVTVCSILSYFQRVFVDPLSDLPILP